MNIDPYYAKGGGSPRPQFGSPGMSGGATRFSEMSPSYTMADQPQMQSPYPYREREPSPEEAQRQQEFNMRLFGLQNNMANMPDMQTQINRQQRDISNMLYSEFPRPALGTINRDTYNTINQIYMRHYLQGTYGSPEMMSEIRTVMQMAPPLFRQASPGTSPQIGFLEGLSSPGTDVVDIQYVKDYKPMPAATVNFQQRLAEMEARRAAAGLPPLKGTRPTPTIGGAGGLPGMRM